LPDKSLSGAASDDSDEPAGDDGWDFRLGAFNCKLDDVSHVDLLLGSVNDAAEGAHDLKDKLIVGAEQGAPGCGLGTSRSEKGDCGDEVKRMDAHGFLLVTDSSKDADTTAQEFRGTHHMPSEVQEWIEGEVKGSFDHDVLRRSGRRGIASGHVNIMPATGFRNVASRVANVSIEIVMRKNSP
jgi:hypothetical protein